MTDEQKKHATYYQSGDVVRFGRAYERSLGVEAGAYAIVLAVDHGRKLVKLELEGGRQIEWSPAKHSKVEVFSVESRKLGVGDELRFTKNDRDLGVNNGSFGRVTGFEGNQVVLSTKTGEIRLDSEQKAHQHWDYAHSMTVYGSQGKTTGEANLLITSESGRAMAERAFRVGITRARDDLAIYTDSSEAALKWITRALDKTSALDSFEGRSGGLVKPDMDGSNAGQNAAKSTGTGGKSAVLER